MPATQTRQKKVVVEQSKVRQTSIERKPVANYVYPHQPPVELKRFQRSSSREDNGSPKSSAEEEEVKPVLTKSVPMEKRFKDVFKISDYTDERRKYSPDDGRVMMEKQRPSIMYKPAPVEEYKETFKKQPQKVTKYSREMEYRAGNKTDKQKYKELTDHRYRSSSPRRREEYGVEQEDLDRIYRAPIERTKSLKRYEQTRGRDYDFEEPLTRNRNRSIEPSTRYRDVSPEDYRALYKQPESMPYRESGQKTMKSSEIPYKSFDESQFERGGVMVDDRWGRGQNDRFDRRPHELEFYQENPSPRVIVHRAEVLHQKIMGTPDSTMQKISPRDRFQNAKEKFQAMERDRPRKQPVEQVKLMRKSIDRSYEPTQYPNNGWSSDEEVQIRHGYKELPSTDRYPGLDRDPVGRMLPSKSLGNLAKGYRHSYAEPRFVETRQYPRTGRVGLAAVNPF